ncbi:MAG: invasion associated locus B family protein [Rhodobacteraceae bacterium]|nr:invasion associated locus B family protein [Paracoccaceae bacterium]
MHTLVKLGAAALIAAFATMAAAQDETQPKTEEFPTGSEPEVQIGQTYQAEQFDDWEIVCVKVESGNEPCEIGQLVLDSSGNPIADVRVFPLPPNSKAIAGATIITPLGVLIQNGLLFSIDDAKPKQYPYLFCNNIGCVSRIGFVPLELQALRKGNVAKMTVRMFNNPDQAIDIAVSLKGFSTAYTALTKRLLEQK